MPFLSCHYNVGTPFIRIGPIHRWHVLDALQAGFAVLTNARIAAVLGQRRFTQVVYAVVVRVEVLVINKTGFPDLGVDIGLVP